MYFSLDKRNDNIQLITKKNNQKFRWNLYLIINKYFFGTENYMENNQYFTNAFLNYKHGMFYRIKIQLKNIKIRI